MNCWPLPVPTFFAPATLGVTARAMVATDGCQILCGGGLTGSSLDIHAKVTARLLMLTMIAVESVEFVWKVFKESVICCAKISMKEIRFQIAKEEKELMKEWDNEQSWSSVLSLY